MANEQIVNEMTSIIYKHIFGMERREFIRAAHQRASEVSGKPVWFQDDESARDYLSIEALSVLAEVEGACAEMYAKINGALVYIERVQAMRSITHHIASQYHVEHMWYEETDK